MPVDLIDRGGLPGSETQLWARSDIATFRDILDAAVRVETECLHEENPNLGVGWTNIGEHLHEPGNFCINAKASPLLGTLGSTGVLLLTRGSPQDLMIRSLMSGTLNASSKASSIYSPRVSSSLD